MADVKIIIVHEMFIGRQSYLVCFIHSMLSAMQKNPARIKCLSAPTTHPQSLNPPHPQEFEVLPAPVLHPQTSNPTHSRTCHQLFENH